MTGSVGQQGHQDVPSVLLKPVRSRRTTSTSTVIKDDFLEAQRDLHRQVRAPTARKPGSDRRPPTGGARREAPPRLIWRRGERERRTTASRAAGGLEALRRRQSRSTRSTSRSAPARSWRSSATTAPASRPSSSASPASTRSTAARSLFEGKQVNIHGPKDAAQARHRGRLPGPRAAPTTSTSCRTCSSAASRPSPASAARRGRRWSSARSETLKTLSVTTIRSVRQTVAGLSGGQRQSVAVAKAVMWNSQARHPRRADGGARRRADAAGARPRQAPRRAGPRGRAHLAQPPRHLRGRRPITVLRLGKDVAGSRRKDTNQREVVEAITAGTLARCPARADGGDRHERRRRASCPAADLADKPDVETESVAEYVAALVGRRPQRRARLAADHRRDLIVIAIVLPEPQNDHFLTAGNFVNLIVQIVGDHDHRHGHRVRAAARRDRPVGRLRLRRRRRHRRAAAAARTATTRSRRCSPASSSRSASASRSASFHGLLITKIGIPSFVVTLAGLLAWNGVVLLLIGSRGTVDPPGRLRHRLRERLPVRGRRVDPRARRRSALYAVMQLVAVRKRGEARACRTIPMLLVARADRRARGPRRRRRLRRQPGPRRPVRRRPRRACCSSSGRSSLERTRFGRHVYAVGGNAEAARRAGINVDRIKIAVLRDLLACMAALGGIVLASRLRSVDTNAGGGSILLYSIAAAVIGGTSLFGGRGAREVARCSARSSSRRSTTGSACSAWARATKFVITGVRAAAAVTVDSISRRGREQPGRA